MQALNNLDRALVWHPFTPLQGAADPIAIAAGEGVYLHTTDGKKIIDAVSSWWVNLHGHSNPHIADAIAKQARTLEHVIFAGFTHAPAVQLAQNLLSILPSNQTKVFFSDNGSTAVEVALKMVFQYWFNQGIDKRKVIALKGAYHGDTFGSMSVGERGIFTDPFKNHLFETLAIDFPSSGQEQQAMDQFKALVDKQDVAAFIYEPLLQGASGMRMYSAEILDKLLEAAKAKGVICIADEVFTGFGRTGKLFASDYCVNKPDVMAVSKGITGGALPLGVTSCSDKIVEAFRTDNFLKTFFHGHSYTANPIACAAANASFELLMKDDCMNSIARIAETHAVFRERIRNHRMVDNVRTLGTILAVELKTSGETGYDNEMRKKIYPYFLERGILLRPLGNVIYMVPPYVISTPQLNEVYHAIEEFLETL